MSRVSVLHVIDSLGPGGAQTALENLVRFADRDRFTPVVAALHGDGVYAPRIKALGTEAFSFAPSKADPRWLLRLATWIRRHRPAILHTHLVVSAAAVEWLLPFIPSGTRFVAHLQNVVAESTDFAYQNFLERRIYRRADAVIGVSRAVLRSYHRIHPEDGRQFLVHNGVDDALLKGRDNAQAEAIRREFGLEAGEPLLLSAARLIGQKNLSHGIKVFAALRKRQPKAQYWIAGTGPDEESLRRLAGELELGDSVRFLGYRQDVPDLLQAADLYMMPSLFEGLPLVLVEAMGAGCIPVVTPFAAAREMVRPGWNGVTIPYEDVEDGAAVISKLLAGGAQSIDIIRLRTTALANRRFAASVMTRRVEDVYTKVLGGRP